MAFCLPRYDHSLNMPIVDVIDLFNFKTIHTYQYNLSQIVDKNSIKLEYYHPLILDDSFIDKRRYIYSIIQSRFYSNLKWSITK